MKKYFAAILSAALLFNLSATLSACNQVEAQEENNIENSITDFAIEAQQDMENATEITLNCVFGDMKGTYAGETKDGLPHGKGKFVSQNKDQRGWYYQGDFVEGHFEGTGKTVFQNGQVQQGSYVRDIWHPSTIQFFEFMQTLPGSNFTINQKAKEIFTSEKDYFPVESPEQLPINENITYEEICNDTEKYGNQFISLSDLSISKHTTFDITENPENLPELRGAYIEASHKDKKENYLLYYRGNIDNLKEDSVIQLAVGIPLDTIKEGDNTYVALAVSYLSLQPNVTE